MSYHLKVGMTDPVTDGGLGAGEEIIDDGDFVTQEHQAVDEMRSDKTSAAGNQDSLAFRRRQKFDRWETRESRIGDRVGVWVEDRFGLVRGKTLGELRVQFFLLRILLGEISVTRSGHDIMRAKIKRSEEINGDFAVETKAIKTDSLDFLTGLVQDPDLSR